MDINMSLVLQKALDTSNVNGNSVLDPVFLSKLISEQVRTIPSLRNAITRVPWVGRTYTWDIVTDFGTAQTATDGGTINTTDAAFAQANSSMSYFYQAAYITNPAILAAQELIDVVSMRVGQATEQVMRKEGSAIYNGDPNNASNIGLNAALAAGVNANIIGSNATAGRSMFSQMDIALRSQGYSPGCFVVTPSVYAVLAEASYNNVRFMGVADQAQVGFPLVQGNVAINGVPVLMDFYAQKFVNIAAQNMASGSGPKNFKFTLDGTTVAANVQRSAGGDYAGTVWTAPIVQISGVTKTAGTDYVFNQDGSITFAATPGVTPTGAFTYAQDNVYCLSLNPKDLLIAEQLKLCVDNDLAKPVAQDQVPLRVKEYCTLAVRDTKAHIMASNVGLPTNFLTQ
jgi:hypothetical protein